MKPTLVEKSPTRGQRNGKTVLEKAQERKKIANLEKPKGKPLSLCSLSNLDPVDVSSIARVFGVSLGVDQISCDKSVQEVLECNRARVAEFEGGCEKCQKDQCDLLDRSNVDSREQGDDSKTSINQNLRPQVEADDEKEGQWTLKVNKRKIKSRLTHEGIFLEH
jgi:hypothetical protein